MAIAACPLSIVRTFYTPGHIAKNIACLVMLKSMLSHAGKWKIPASWYKHIRSLLVAKHVKKHGFLFIQLINGCLNIQKQHTIIIYTSLTLLALFHHNLIVESLRIRYKHQCYSCFHTGCSVVHAKMLLDFRDFWLISDQLIYIHKHDGNLKLWPGVFRAGRMVVINHSLSHSNLSNIPFAQM